MKTQEEINAAVRKPFGNLADSVARGLNYANPVTFTKNLWDYAGNELPNQIKTFDKKRGNEMRADLAESRGGPSFFPTPMNQTQAQADAQPVQEIPRTVGASPVGASPVIGGVNNNNPPADEYGNILSDEGVMGLTNPKIKTLDLPPNIRERSQLPGGNQLNSVPDFNEVGGEQIPTFDNQYVNKDYTALNDRESNEKLAARNEADMDNQTRRSRKFIDSLNLNRGTPAGGQIPFQLPQQIKRKEKRYSDDFKGMVERKQDMKARALDIAENDDMAKNAIAAQRVAQAGQNATTRNNLPTRPQAAAPTQEVVKPLTRDDEVANLKKAQEFGETFDSRIVKGLPPVVGEEIYNLAGDGRSIADVKGRLDSVLLRLKQDNKDEYIINNPGEVISLLKEDLRQ